MKKTYKSVLPCGILQEGDRVYHVLSPSPVPAESWQHTEQQRFSVVPFDRVGLRKAGIFDESDGEYIHEELYGYARHLVCSNPAGDGMEDVEGPLHQLATLAGFEGRKQFGQSLAFLTQNGQRGTQSIGPRGGTIRLRRWAGIPGR